jgi:hypothetical protein
MGTILRLGYVFSLLAVPISMNAQRFLAGKIYKKNTDEVIVAVTVEDIHVLRYSSSDMGGNYRIEVSLGDTVVFSTAGYRSDTLIVGEATLASRYDLYLSPRVVQLATVNIGDLNSYEVDSIQRRADYESFYQDHYTTVVSHNGPTDGLGIAFSPFDHFSKKEKRQRELRKRLIRDEEQFYINYKFPRPYVAKLTGLTGDSLQLFMVRNRPTYSFCRNATEQDMLLYINDRLILFRRGANRHPTP